LNLTAELLRTSRDQVEDVREKIGVLEEGVRTPPQIGNGDDERDDPLLRGFRERMDDDLDVPGAWEVVSSRVEALAKDRRDGRLEPVAAQRTIRSLRKVDRVLGVLFP
jgi:hypothetical protein